MEKLTEKPPLSRTDKLCIAALAGLILSASLTDWAMDAAAYKAAEADKPTALTITAPAIDVVPLLEALEARREELYWEAVPLDQECRDALQEACLAHSVPVCVVLGLIEVESGFQPAADNGLSYGLMQLNKRYYPPDLTPADNIRAGAAYLGELLERYGGDTAAALTAYNAGHDTGNRTYARAVLDASEKWGGG